MFKLVLWVELCPPERHVQSPNSQYLRMCPYLEQGLNRSNQVKMRSVWALIQYDWCSYKKGKS